MPIAVATSCQQLDLIATALMLDNEQDSMSLKKLKKRDGAWVLRGDMLGFNFNRDVGLKTL